MWRRVDLFFHIEAKSSIISTKKFIQNILTFSEDRISDFKDTRHFIKIDLMRGVFGVDDIPNPMTFTLDDVILEYSCVFINDGFIHDFEVNFEFGFCCTMLIK